MDVAIAMQHPLLAATELGMVTCWIGNFDEKIARKELGIPSQLSMIEIVNL